MNTWHIDEIARVCRGTVVSRGKTHAIGLGTDTRKDLRGRLFIALRGEKYDAHQFIDKAIRSGTNLLIVDHLVGNLDIFSEVGVVQVQDTLRALQDLAHDHRKKSRARFVGITGSNGKTSTKEFLAQILALRFTTSFSKGSFNNHWGLPLSILEVDPEKTDVAILEMGMNHKGEITELVKIADPDLVLCTMVGTAHIEHFGTQDKIAAAKEEIYLTARREAIRLYNLDNDWTRGMWARSGEFANKFCFGSGKTCDLSMEFVGMTESHLEVNLSFKSGVCFEGLRIPVFGRQNLVNLQAAAAAALALGMAEGEISEGLKTCATIWGRSQWLDGAKGTRILFDAYNANPESMSAMLENIAILSGSPNSRVGVFGNMLELGTDSMRFHEKLGAQVARTGFRTVFFVGPDHLSFQAGFLSEENRQTSVLYTFPIIDKVVRDLLDAEIQSGDHVFFKASRGMNFESLVEILSK